MKGIGKDFLDGRKKSGVGPESENQRDGKRSYL